MNNKFIQKIFTSWPINKYIINYDKIKELRNKPDELKDTGRNYNRIYFFDTISLL